RPRGIPLRPVRDQFAHRTAWLLAAGSRGCRHPAAGEHALRTEDIIELIDHHRSEIALVLMDGVNYYTGEFLDIPAITAAAHRYGILAGYDLAHAAGNVPLSLHDWDVDFAVWCSYKYLNGAPSCVAGR